MSDPFRKQYRQISDVCASTILSLKSDAYHMWQTLDAACGYEDENKADSRCLALAKTKLEEAVMWATKGLT